MGAHVTTAIKLTLATTLISIKLGDRTLLINRICFPPTTSISAACLHLFSFKCFLSPCFWLNVLFIPLRYKLGMETLLLVSSWLWNCTIWIRLDIFHIWINKKPLSKLIWSFVVLLNLFFLNASTTRAMNTLHVYIQCIYLSFN